MAQINIRVIVMREGETWIAQALEYDIGAQANDLDTLKRRFDLTLKVELEESVAKTGSPFGGIDPAPDYFHTKWSDDNGFTSKGQAETSQTGAPPVGYAMRLAA